MKSYRQTVRVVCILVLDNPQCKWTSSLFHPEFFSFCWPHFQVFFWYVPCVFKVAFALSTHGRRRGFILKWADFMVQQFSRALQLPIAHSRIFVKKRKRRRRSFFFSCLKFHYSRLRLFIGIFFWGSVVMVLRQVFLSTNHKKWWKK